MNLEDLFAQIRALPDADFHRLSDEMYVISREREARDQVEAGQAQLVAELQDAGKLEKPDAATAEQAQEHADTVPEWRDPGTSHELMYRKGDVVRHGDKIVRSTHPGLNHWVPGTLAFDGRIWEIIGTVDEQDSQGTDADAPGTEGQDTDTTEPAPETTKPAAPPYKQPTGAHDAYSKGDKITYNGEVYESTINGNVWNPDAYPAGWRRI